MEKKVIEKKLITNEFTAIQMFKNFCEFFKVRSKLNKYLIHICYYIKIIIIILFVFLFVSEIKDPCRNVNCSLGSQCVRSRDGTDAKCECLKSCPNLGDHEGSGPVCGTDGVDYQSVCELNRLACANGTNVTVAFRGKCGE